MLHLYEYCIDDWWMEEAWNVEVADIVSATFAINWSFSIWVHRQSQIAPASHPSLLSTFRRYRSVWTQYKKKSKLNLNFRLTRYDSFPRLECLSTYASTLPPTNCFSVSPISVFIDVIDILANKSRYNVTSTWPFSIRPKHLGGVSIVLKGGLSHRPHTSHLTRQWCVCWGNFTHVLTSALPRPLNTPVHPLLLSANHQCHHWKKTARIGRN